MYYTVDMFEINESRCIHCAAKQKCDRIYGMGMYNKHF